MAITRFDQYIKPGSIYRSFPEMGYKEYEFDSTHSIQDIEESIFKNSINTQRKKNDEKILRDSKFNEEKFIKNINFNLSIFGIIFFISNAIPILGIIYFGSEFFIPYILKSPTIFYIFKNQASLPNLLRSMGREKFIPRFASQSKSPMFTTNTSTLLLPS